MKIEIQNPQVEVRNGTGRDQRPFQIRRQVAYAHLAGLAYPVMMRLQLEDSNQGFQPGMYELDESSFYVGKYGELAISRSVRLRPVSVKA
ncbi:single-stranded DNA-binding protein [Rheinheimera riviphila]|nr:single-stranded DNA-binding protein [Rheinheimera riviphila]